MTTNWETLITIHKMNFYEMRFCYKTIYSDEEQYFQYTFVGIAGFYNALDTLHHFEKQPYVKKIIGIAVSRAIIIC